MIEDEMRETYRKKSVNVSLLGLLLGHALVLVPGLPLVLAGQVYIVNKVCASRLSAKEVSS